jgi:Uma2 family endonuclease
MQVRERTFEEIVLANPGRKLEMYEGQVREKPFMSIGHNRMEVELFFSLRVQLGKSLFDVRMGQAPVKWSDRNYYLPDVYVVRRHPGRVPLDTFEVFLDPLPFLAEIWSPSTGDYDIDRKLPGYRERGDLEIWRLHPFEKTLTAWRRQADGRYTESIIRSGVVALHALPGVSVDLDELFNLD